jgi:hypothetical protein
MMIATMLIGGLGNQMFQYAAGRALALHHDTHLLLDNSSLGRTDASGADLRSFELDRFAITGTALPGSFTAARLALARRPSPLLQRISGWHAYREPILNFDRGVEVQRDKTYLIGYWQSWRYFDAVARHIAAEFRPVASLSDASKAMLEMIDARPSICVHVRRGDYARAAQVTAHHGLIGMEYYEASIRHIQAGVAGARILLFSDDPEWCRSAFTPLGLDIVVVDVNRGEDSWQDMMLMAACDHAVIANSSFSWWGAWLGDQWRSDPNRIVTAPASWFAGEATNMADRCPPTWKIV